MAITWSQPCLSCTHHCSIPSAVTVLEPERSLIWAELEEYEIKSCLQGLMQQEAPKSMMRGGDGEGVMDENTESMKVGKEWRDNKSA